MVKQKNLSSWGEKGRGPDLGPNFGVFMTRPHSANNNKPLTSN